MPSDPNVEHDQKPTLVKPVPGWPGGGWPAIVTVLIAIWALFDLVGESQARMHEAADCWSHGDIYAWAGAYDDHLQQVVDRGIEEVRGAECRRKVTVVSLRKQGLVQGQTIQIVYTGEFRDEYNEPVNLRTQAQPLD
jgi:hypothetical protein